MIHLLTSAHVEGKEGGNLVGDRPIYLFFERISEHIDGRLLHQAPRESGFPSSAFWRGRRQATVTFHLEMILLSDPLRLSNIAIIVVMSIIRFVNAEFLVIPLLVTANGRSSSPRRRRYGDDLSELLAIAVTGQRSTIMGIQRRLTTDEARTGQWSSRRRWRDVLSLDMNRLTAATRSSRAIRDHGRSGGRLMIFFEEDGISASTSRSLVLVDELDLIFLESTSSSARAVVTSSSSSSSSTEPLLHRSGRTTPVTTLFHIGPPTIVIVEAVMFFKVAAWTLVDNVSLLSDSSISSFVVISFSIEALRVPATASSSTTNKATGGRSIRIGS